MPDEERGFVNVSEANVDTLKQDLSLRIAEAANSAKYLYGAATTGDGDTYKYLKEFLRDFYSLYDQSKDQLDKKQRGLVEEGGKLEYGNDTVEIDSLEEYFLSPMITYENEDGEQQIDIGSTTTKALILYRIYKKFLRECGLLKLDRTEHRQGGVGGKN